ncbi:hypothetical protein Goklo_024605 [Gossypium klotzschianum]|uniref:Uncharacterized protein n=1 Tax=Gossypium klotzschianum TaxID=34286 RepID=A0A7J8WA72_9ROSI|nr:hypothetical protein [Gossypium klotzschianum]
MEKGFLDKVEDNAVVQTWSETTHRKKDHSLAEGYVSKSWDFTRISVTQNSLQELKEIWDQWNDEVKKLFYFGYGDPSYLFDIKVDKHLFRPSPCFGILLTVVSPLGELIWCLQWRNTWPYFVAQRFKWTKPTRELLMS